MTEETAANWETERREMVQHQLRERGVTDPAVLEAICQVPRERFVPPQGRVFAYDDRALPIGYGQTISQPYMVAFMIQALQVESQSRVLEIGAGSGYQAAVLSRLCREVWGLEIIEQLASRAQAVLAELGYDNVTIIQGDGSVGYPPAAPYDRIIVAAGAPRIPDPLVEQLAEGGRMVVPVGDRTLQQCMVSVKHEGQLEVVESIGCVFVPLLGKHGWSGL